MHGPFIIYYLQQVWDNSLLSNTLIFLQQNIDWLLTQNKASKNYE